MARESSFKGIIGRGKIVQSDCFLLQPTTFMNSSGESVVRMRDYYNILEFRILVICDEVRLPFGKLRLSLQGSSGGHHGQASVIERLGTQHYPRLRIGVGAPASDELSEYVLTPFGDGQRLELPSLLEKAAVTVEDWIKKIGVVNTWEN